jgi:hypothetical protein
MISVSISGSATSAVANLLASLRRPRPIVMAGAKYAQRTLRDHFLAREQQPNKQGWPKAHLWRRIATSTAVAGVTDTEAVLSIAHPAISAKVYGAEITPKRGKFLTIPAMAAAYAAGSPREGAAPGNLAFAYSLHPQGGWRPSLAVQTDVWKEVGKPRRDGTRRVKTVNRAGEIWYWLVRRAVVHGDPNALPSDDLVADTAISAALTFLNSPYGARSQVSP